ncbi:AAA family ATPase [Clavibacter michiganensis]|uniref:AAA family ATPase n=1 Tax=Clavibacter michiganensis TaxID=28447 RepID=UPI0026DBA24E|nr:AAA family ATPase [Clavibacter michiganensis]MDO4039280.1 AAA family ATPase [Clavibacter michiganensis]MDO4063917.1 AAA family ATPase [Clavibacter michiganensis]MDO4110224.1 AAA family ATPase [Clavibacter michiganensis]MDO4113402.1 AAA family ATPase [Clavibacter michiganensis]MDO4116738.1 AAA family ATPase [Clavibacter michiganensis]
MLLSTWANDNDEWVVAIARLVLSTGRALLDTDIDDVYALFRQENALDGRTLPKELPLAVAASPAESDEVLRITSLSEITGVNALVSDAVITPHEGLTILYGENGTGKTGYSRLFKALAASRTADQILGDVSHATASAQGALIAYNLGDTEHSFRWSGETGGVTPFTRMSIFDSPSVNAHVDADLEYVYVPASLALFNHVNAGIQAVEARISADLAALATDASALLSRIPRGATAYPLVEMLGAATDLDTLRALADTSDDVDERIAGLQKAVAALEAGTLPATIRAQQRVSRVLVQAISVATGLEAFDVDAYNSTRTTMAALEIDYAVVRTELFEADDLPAAPDDTWKTFIEVGESYRQHLVTAGAHDENRCLYCHQPLRERAQELVAKYADYLADKIGADIAESRKLLAEAATTVASIEAPEVTAWVIELADQTERPEFYAHVASIASALDAIKASTSSGTAVDHELTAQIAAAHAVLTVRLAEVDGEVKVLESEDADRAETLQTKRRELVELTAAAEIGRSWATIDTQVKNAKEAARLTVLARPALALRRAVTALSKIASDALMNQSFATYFAEECAALRAPLLKVEYIGRDGNAKRRKVLVKKHRPSKVLSEGEQKVLALADFLAEARLSGISAPVIFDDPVSSLDHRRINEVAARIANLAQSAQVLVFTHDLAFTMTLLHLMEASKRCAYFQIDDEKGKGRVTRSSHPRWDTMKGLAKNIDETIAAARAQDGQARAALVRTGYGWLRSWCEVFTEMELLQGVTRRHQPAVHMTQLGKIKSGALTAAIDPVVRVFEEACRYIDSHSQPLTTLNVTPTLSGLEAHWAELQITRAAYLHAAD